MELPGITVYGRGVKIAQVRLGFPLDERAQHALIVTLLFKGLDNESFEILDKERIFRSPIKRHATGG